MELQRDRPPAYLSHDPEGLILPSVPQSDLIRPQSATSDITLPDLRTVLGDLPTKTVHPNILLSTSTTVTLPPRASNDFSTAAAAAAAAAGSRHGGDHRSLPRMDMSPVSRTGRSSIESLISPSDTASVMSVEEHSQRSTSVSLEDPDVRLAAEALSGLGKSGYGRQAHSIPSQSSPSVSEQQQQQHQQEPLLCLLPGRHPWVGSTITGSLSAYNTTKNYSPGFVRYGAELVERNIGTPIASTVSSVARRTGVENGLRRYLSSGRVNPAETDSASSKKRRRVMGDSHNNTPLLDGNGGMDQSMQDSMPDASMEDLPPYVRRTSKPPSYREEVSPHERSQGHSNPRQQQQQHQQHQKGATQQHSPAMTMAGLYVAMSDASLRSLRYCVDLLVTACTHIETVMRALKLVLQDMEDPTSSSHHHQQQSSSSSSSNKAIEAGVFVPQEERDEDETEALARRIQGYCDDIMNTLKTVVNKISTYAGGALPENAREYIKSQLLSVPQRWRWATQSTSSPSSNSPHLSSSSSPHLLSSASMGPAVSMGGTSEKADLGEDGRAGRGAEETRRSARRMIAFATEGIDMMQAVNTVIRNTCLEAEKWMDTLPGFNRGRGSGGGGGGVAEGEGGGLREGEILERERIEERRRGREGTGSDAEMVDAYEPL